MTTTTRSLPTRGGGRGPSALVPRAVRRRGWLDAPEARRSVRRVFRLLPLLPAVLALLSCRSDPAPSLLDREYAVYQAEREEARLEDLKARQAKAKGEADRLAAELAALEAEVRARRQRVHAAAAAGMRLPDAMRLSDAPAIPPSGASPAAGGGPGAAR